MLVSGGADSGQGQRSLSACVLQSFALWHPVMLQPATTIRPWSSTSLAFTITDSRWGRRQLVPIRPRPAL